MKQNKTNRTKSSNPLSVMTLLKSAFSLAFLLATHTADAQNSSIGNITRNLNGTAIDFYKDLIPKNLKATFLPSGTTNAEIVAATKAINDSITSASASGGGVIIFNRGTHTLNQINLKSNVRLEMRPGVVFKMNARVLFNIGREASRMQDKVYNVEIIAKNPNKRFVIDATKFAPIAEAIPIRVAYAQNFAISRFTILDNFTKIPAVFLIADDQYVNGASVVSTLNRVPSFGVVKDGDVENTAVGYALVQLFSGNNVLLENLKSKKGITVRLETGNGKPGDPFNDIVDQSFGNIHHILLNNIEIEEGFAALFMKPHSRICSDIEANNIKAINSLSSVYIASTELKPITKRGRFTNTVVTGVSFAQTIPNSTTNFPADTGLEGLRFMSEEFRQLIKDRFDNLIPKPSNFLDAVPKDPTEERYVAQPLAPIMMLSRVSATNLGDLALGRFDVSLPNLNDIQITGGIFTGPKIIYRESAKTIVTGQIDHNYIND
ncbi:MULTISPECIES: hypothetical protein [Flavobacterium]|uniref:Uncharacterized protein n=1 Tax=Flavobacterium jumunjinense TaxID=998845 RepID=A0ABV5GKZ6_9FLAO|nr:MULTISPECIES: hypothetical protein [Flavobacterium]